MLVQNIKLVFRNHIRQFRTTILNVFGLSLGMALFIILMLYFLNEYNYDIHHKRINEIYRVYEKYSGEDQLSSSLAMPLPNILADDFEEIDKVGSFWGIETEVRLKNNARIASLCYSVEPDVFSMFDFHFLYGSPSTALSDPSTVVITEDFSRKLFGDSLAIGNTVNIDEHIFTVSGVIETQPDNSLFKFDMLVSDRLRTIVFPDWEKRWWHGAVYTFFIPKSAELLPVIQKKLSEIPEKYYPSWLDKNVKYFARPMKRSHLYNEVPYDMKPTVSITYLYTLLAIAFSILLIACTNYINLAKAQSLTRKKSVAISKIHGAKSSSQFFQQLTDSIIVAFVSLGFALILTEQLLPLFTKLTGVELHFEYGNIFMLLGLFVFGITIGTFSGLYPSYRLATVKPYQASSGKFLSHDKKVILQKGSIALQFTVTIILIISVLEIIKQSVFMKNYDVGFNRKNLLVIPVGNSDNYSARYSEALLFRDEVNKYSHQYGYSIGALTENIPGYYFQNYFKIIPDGFTDKDDIRIISTAVDENFLKVYGIKMIQGRFFSREYPSDNVAFIINNAAMKKFGWDDVTGKYIRLSHEGEAYPVVGVMKDIVISSLHNEKEPLLYRFGRHNNFPGFITFRINEKNKEEIVRFLNEKWNNLFPEYSFYYFSVEDKYLEHYKNDAILTKIILVFCLIAVILSCLGLYSYVSHETIKRTKEIGIRKVNGSNTTEIMLLLFKDFVKWVFLAFVIACPIAYYFMHRWLQNFAARTGLSWWVFAAAGVLALSVALLTVSWQSWQAASKNPVKALRYE